MTTLALSRPYPCLSGGPTLDRVDGDVFRLTYFAECMACGFCFDRCCRFGVDVDAENVDRLLALRVEIEAFTGIPSTRWFDGVWRDDPEYPGGRAMRTRVEGRGCVFLAPVGQRGCRLHAFALQTGRPVAPLKPMISQLFPLTFDQGLLLPSEELRDGTLPCTGEGPTAYRGARDSVRDHFGPELVAELDALEAAAR